MVSRPSEHLAHLHRRLDSREAREQVDVADQVVEDGAECPLGGDDRFIFDGVDVAPHAKEGVVQDL